MSYFAVAAIVVVWFANSVVLVQDCCLLFSLLCLSIVACYLYVLFVLLLVYEGWWFVLGVVACFG